MILWLSRLKNTWRFRLMNSKIYFFCICIFFIYIFPSSKKYWPRNMRILNIFYKTNLLFLYPRILQMYKCIYLKSKYIFSQKKCYLLFSDARIINRVMATWCRLPTTHVYQLKIQWGCAIFLLVSVRTRYHLVFRLLVLFKIE